MQEDQERPEKTTTRVHARQPETSLACEGEPGGAIDSFLRNHTKVLFVAMAAIVLLMVLVYSLKLSLAGMAFGQRLVLLLGIAGLGIFSVACFLVFFRKVRIERVFLVVALVLGVMFSGVFPAGSVPDETFHYKGTTRIANIMTGVPVDDSHGQITYSQSDSELPISNEMSTKRYVDLAADFEVFSSDSSDATCQLVSSSFTQNLPQERIPAACGIILARLLNLGAVPAFYLGRLFNLIYYAVLFFLAIKLIPFGKIAVAAVGLLPMSLTLAASYSYDGPTIAMTALFVALIVRAAYGGQEVALGRRLRIAIVVLAFVMSPCKTIYVLLLLLVLIIPKERFSSTRDRLLFCGGVLLAGVGSLLLANVVASLTAPVLDPTYAQSLGTGPVYYTFSDLIADPVHFMGLTLRALAVYGDFYLQTIVGGNAGWFQLQLPWSLVVAFYAILLLSFQRRRGEPADLAPSRKLVAFLVAFLIVGGLFVVFYVSWTTPLASQIEGIQGRYMIPALLPIFLVLRNRFVVVSRRTDAYLLCAMVGMNVIYLVTLLSMAFMAV